MPEHPERQPSEGRAGDVRPRFEVDMPVAYRERGGDVWVRLQRVAASLWSEAGVSIGERFANPAATAFVESLERDRAASESDVLGTHAALLAALADVTPVRVAPPRLLSGWRVVTCAKGDTARVRVVATKSRSLLIAWHGARLPRRRDALARSVLAVVDLHRPVGVDVQALWCPADPGAILGGREIDGSILCERRDGRCREGR